MALYKLHYCTVLYYHFFLNGKPRDDISNNHRMHHNWLTDELSIKDHFDISDSSAVSTVTTSMLNLHTVSSVDPIHVK